jgi:CTP synthase (UTP-ammonia lyase)
MNLPEADHEETAQDGSRMLISKLSCSLVGQTQTVRLKPDTLTRRAYGRGEVVEQFTCNYGLNPDYQRDIEAGGLRVTGVGEDGEARIVELEQHPFFVASLFVPQLTSSPEAPHPLISAYLRAALEFRAGRPVFHVTGTPACPRSDRQAPGWGAPSGG